MKGCLSQANTTLSDADDIITFSINELKELNTTISIKLKNNLEKRIHQRRNIYSEILNYLVSKKLTNKNERLIFNEIKLLSDRLFFSNNESDLNDTLNSTLLSSSCSSNDNSGILARWNSLKKKENILFLHNQLIIQVMK